MEPDRTDGEDRELEGWALAATVVLVAVLAALFALALAFGWL